MRIWLYIRYSSVNQEDGVSIDLQQSALRTFIASEPFLAKVAQRDIIDCIDEAKTGTTFVGRHAFARILRESQKGDVLLIYKYDRLGRNLIESLLNLKTLEERNGICVYSATESNQPFVRNILLTMAEEFSRQLGDRCKRALDSRALQGFATNKAPFGYRLHRDGGKGGARYMLEAAEAKIVARIFDCRAQGWSFKTIAGTLNQERQKSPKGQLWTSGTIRSILHNEAYLGTILSGVRLFKKGFRGPGSGKKRPSSEWKRRDDAHAAIISREVWDRIRALDGASLPARESSLRANYLWSGVVKCAQCGSNLTRHTCKNGVYYGCDSHAKYGDRLTCHNRYLVREEELNEYTLSLLEDFVFCPEFVDDLIAVVRGQVTQLTQANHDTVRPLERTRDRVSSEYEAVVRNLAKTKDEEMYAIMVDEANKLKAERDSLRGQIEQHKKLAGATVDVDQIEARVRSKLEQFFGALRSQDVPAARSGLADQIEKLEVTPDRELIVHPNPKGLLAGVGAGVACLTNCNADVGAGNIPTGI